MLILVNHVKGLDYLGEVKDELSCLCFEIYKEYGNINLNGCVIEARNKKYEIVTTRIAKNDKGWRIIYVLSDYFI